MRVAAGAIARKVVASVSIRAALVQVAFGPYAATVLNVFTDSQGQYVLVLAPSSPTADAARTALERLKSSRSGSGCSLS